MINQTILFYSIGNLMQKQNKQELTNLFRNSLEANFLKEKFYGEKRFR